MRLTQAEDLVIMLLLCCHLIKCMGVRGDLREGRLALAVMNGIIAMGLGLPAGVGGVGHVSGVVVV